jgi:hypothetical protein
MRSIGVGKERVDMTTTSQAVASDDDSEVIWFQDDGSARARIDIRIGDRLITSTGGLAGLDAMDPMMRRVAINTLVSNLAAGVCAEMERGG